MLKWIGPIEGARRLLSFFFVYDFRVLSISILAVLVVAFLRRSRLFTKNGRVRKERTHSITNLSSSERSFIRSRTLSWEGFSSFRTSNAARPRGSSFDLGFPLHSASASALDEKLKELSKPTRSSAVGQGNTNIAPNNYHGPKVRMILYETWTPPPSWAETAKRLLPSEVPTLRRTLKVEIANESTLSILVPSTDKGEAKEADFFLSVHEFSVHPKPPAEGGVLEIYVKDSPRSEWMEHTFATAQDAAQFQLDLQCLQTFGKEIYNMYQALEIIHRGSLAFAGVETVVHDAQYFQGDRNGGEPTGIAWDDVMRSLGVHFPLMRWRLEQLWWTEMSGIERSSQGDNEDVDDSLGLVQEYRKKRLLIGLVDFFRLFVPHLPVGSTTETRPTAERFERLLRWRKRVARASLLVQSYVSAKIVANTGWELDAAIPNGYWSKRLAFDENMDNTIRDSTTENEIYEPTVSRDLQCFVRGSGDANDFLRSKGQAFMLVDAHLFNCDDTLGSGLSDFSGDPVEILPSLRNLVKSNQSSEFFVMGVRLQNGIVAVYVFARSLPFGIDDSFERAWTAFRESDPSTRSQRLECVLSVRMRSRGMSLLSLLFWKILSWALRFLSRTSYVSRRETGTSDNYTLGCFRLSLFGKMHHFGGSLQTNPRLPKNYVAASLHLPSDENTNVIWNYLTKRVFLSSKEIFDCSLKIAASNKGDFPERALTAVRHVRLSSSLRPLSFNRSLLPKKQDRRSSGGVVGWRALLVGQFTADAVSSITSMMGSEETRRSSARIIATADPIEKAINSIIELIDDIRIPELNIASCVEIHDESMHANLCCPPSAGPALQGRKDLRHVQVVDKITRDDIRRFYVSSGLNVKAAAVNIVDTTAWRGLTFPIDTRACRLELQNGQFFQQGRDLSGHPVFYFRAMSRGPWRGDEEALISCILHRFDTSMERLASSNPNIRCTFVAILGRPVEKGSDRLNDDDHSQDSESHGSHSSGDELHEAVNIEAYMGSSRISPNEPYQLHANMRVLHRLAHLMISHYPERLYRALVVTKNSGKLRSTNAKSKLAFKDFLKHPGVRDRVKTLRRYQDLETYIHKNELVDFAGGNAAVDHLAFRF